HQQKIRELTKLTDDMDNLLGCTNVGTLFLDPNMSVRKFTSAVTDHFRLRDSDVGRPLDEISSRIRAPDLIDRARRVFESGAGEQFEALGGGGVALLIGVNPYRTGRGLVDGVVVTIVDIDSLKEAEQRAAALSTQNQLILDHIPAMVWYKDRMCRIVRANRAAAELTGLPISEIEGKSTEELHPAEAERYIRDDREVMKSGTPKLGIIEPVRDSEDSERWVRTDKVPLFGEDGAVNGLLAVTTDITDVKKTEDALVRTSRLLELSQRAAQQGHFTLDLRTDELHVSDEWKAALGYEPFEAQIGSTGELLAVVHAEDRPALRDAIETCRRGETARLDRTHRINAKIGGPVWVRSIGEVYEREEGVPARVVGTLTVVDDVVRAQLELERVNADLESVVRERTAELEVSKKRFERAINGAQKGVWEWVPPDEACWFADHFWEILGFRREDHPPPLLSSFHERIHPDELDMTRESLDRLAHHGGLLSVRLRLWTQDGNYRWFQLRALRDTEPGLNRVVLTGSIVDVHDEVSAREALETTKSELEARVAARTEELSANVQTLADRNEQLDQFAHVAAHDLRAPLRTIAGNAELAIMGRGPAENAQNGTTDRHLEKILAGTRRMSELIDSLSAYSRVGRADCLIDDADLDRIIEGIRADLETDLAESGGELVSGPLGVVRADPRMIAQVLRNLIANGIKFVRDKPPRVAVSRDDRDGETRIRVTDNGIGIDSQFRAAIFEPFKRLNAGSEFAGSGVGLSICRRIVERHGGEIWVESVPEGGSSFVFTLPSVVSTA
ncbi:MAG: PAS domain-containing protein, partial [Planctomycetota bacterium]